MILTGLLLVIGGLIGFVAWIWLIVVAFRVSTGWGLLILLLSWTWIPLIIFAVQHWPMAKRPLMLYGLALAVTLAASLIAFLVFGLEMSSLINESGGVMARPGAQIESEDTVLPPPRPTAEPTHPSWESIVNEIDRDTDDSWEELVPDPTPVAEDREKGVISWNEAAAHIGRAVEVRLSNGTKMTAALEAVEPGRIRVRHVIGGGEASYWIERDQVKRIKLYR